MEQIPVDKATVNSFIENRLHWRKAIKCFDCQKLVTEADFTLLLESLRLSASSINIQPWKFLVIKNKVIRKELQALSLNQAQITEASHLLILCSLKKVDGDYLDRLIKLDKEQNIRSSLESFKPIAMSYIESKTDEQLKAWLAEQVYIALGFLLFSCAMLQIDACPIEAFDRGKVNKLLDLHKLGIESKVMVAIGYRDPKDNYAMKNKIRWPKEEVVITVS